MYFVQMSRSESFFLSMSVTVEGRRGLRRRKILPLFQGWNEGRPGDGPMLVRHHSGVQVGAGSCRGSAQSTEPSRMKKCELHPT